MKKLIALLIFAGLASAGFANPGYGNENKDEAAVSAIQQSQNTVVNYTTANMQSNYAASRTGYARDEKYDGYSRYRFHRHHHHERRHRHEHRRFHRGY